MLRILGGQRAIPRFAFPVRSGVTGVRVLDFQPWWSTSTPQLTGFVGRRFILGMHAWPNPISICVRLQNNRCPWRRQGNWAIRCNWLHSPNKVMRKHVDPMNWPPPETISCIISITRGNFESASVLSPPFLTLDALAKSYEFSGLKSKSLKRRSDQRYAHFSIIGM